MNREKVYKLINEERDYQDETAKVWNHKGVPTLAAELLMMEEYLVTARHQWTISSNGSDALHTIRKIAGMCVRCLENHGNPYISRKSVEEVADELEKEEKTRKLDVGSTQLWNPE